MKDELIYEEIGKKIKIERKKRKISQKELAKIVGINNEGTLGTYETGRNRVPVDVLIRLTNYFKIPLTKFLSFADSETGKTKKDIDLIPYTNHDELHDELRADGNIIKVKVYSVVGAGNFVGFSSFNPINEIYLLKEFYKKGMVAVKVKGESMEPTVREGGYVGVDINDKEYIAGKIYAVFLKDEGVAIKRVFVNDGKAILKSDNPIFPERVVNKENTDDYFLIGRVKWVMQEI
ncbi:MAG: XRE family transcriptional regulator [bacterium]